MPNDTAKSRPIFYVPAILAACIVLSLILDPIWAEKYSLIHTVLEITCVIIASSTFVVLWFSEKTGHTNMILAIGFLAVAIFDMFHIIYSNALVYYPPGYLDLGARYWVLGRFTEASFLVLSTTRLNKAIHNKYLASFSTVIIAVGAGVMLYNSPHLLPVLLTPRGMTPVKIIAEYVIIALFLFYLYRVHTGKIGDNIVQKDYMIMAIALAVPSEVCFTLYSTYDFYNLLGHLLRVAYYYCLLRAIVEGYVLYPYKALKFSENLFSKTFHDSNVVMALSRLRYGTYVDVNSAWATALGYSREELIGRSVSEFDIWADPAQRETVVEQLQQEGHITDLESKYRKKSGEVGYAFSTINTVEIDGEEHVLISAIDITKRKKAEEDLAKSQKLLQQIFDSIPLSIMVSSINDKEIVVVNDTFLSRHNCTRESLIGLEPIQARIWKNLEERDRYYETIKRNGNVKNFEAENYSPSGEITTVLLSGILILWGGEECILSIANDITEFKQYEKELSRLANLNVMGQMAGSIAHEVRNPMTSVKGFLQLFKEQERYEDDLYAFEIMIGELDRVNEIISTFLSLAQMNILDMQIGCLNDSITDILPLIQSDTLMNDINMDTRLGTVPAVRFDKGEIRQLAINLIRNAIQAMPSGGTLTIRTFADDLGVHLEIQDEGGGIPPQVIDKIGSGLGMAVCYSIAQQHDARITFDTSPAGTSFKVTFPAAS